MNFYPSMDKTRLNFNILYIASYLATKIKSETRSYFLLLSLIGSVFVSEFTMGD